MLMAVVVCAGLMLVGLIYAGNRALISVNDQEDRTDAVEDIHDYLLGLNNDPCFTVYKMVGLLDDGSKDIECSIFYTNRHIEKMSMRLRYTLSNQYVTYGSAYLTVWESTTNKEKRLDPTKESTLDVVESIINKWKKSEY